MRSSEILKAYRRYAPVYDLVFGSIMSDGRRLAARMINASGAREVLEIGVGTGLSLPFYDRGVAVHGIDLSPEMLKKAEKRIRRRGLTNARVERMNAQELRYADNTFDAVALIHTLSAVEDPLAVLKEVRRVAKPDALVVICNHFQSRHPLLSRAERMLRPVSGLVGFEPAPYEGILLDFPGMRVEETRRVNLGGYWKLFRCRVLKDAGIGDSANLSPKPSH